MALRIGVYSPWNTADPSAWSGVVLPMVETLRDFADVEFIPAVGVSDALPERLRTRLRGMRRRRSLPTHTMATAQRRSSALAERLAERTGPAMDALVAIAGSTDVLALPEGLPLVQITDATFPAITGFYPLATGLGARNERQGLAVERAGAAVTSHYVVASDWAAKSLVHDVGVAPARVSVAPFGPGTPAPPAPMVRDLDGPLKVLAVIADWERKRGDDVIAAVDRARAHRPLELTVAGRAPDGLPSWVRHEGVVPRGRLAELYAEHHVLVDLASANAAGVVMTDALVSGLPVLATRVGGVETIVQDGVTGWLVDASGAVAQAAHVLSEVDGDAVNVASRAALDDASRRVNWTAWGRSVLAAVESAVVDPVGGDSPQGVAPIAGGRRGRVAMVSPILPSADRHESAGERLVHDVVDVLSESADLTLLTGDGPANRRALERGGVPPHRLVTRSPRRLGRLERALGLSPALSPRDLQEVRGVIADADVVDLQWEENALLLPTLRRLNPRARTVVTLHDVLSQRFERQRDLQKGPTRKAVWETRRLAARALERALLRAADDIVVLSDKDAALLPAARRGARVHVVPPAITGDLRPARGSVSSTPLLLFVGFMARWENEDAMHWFVTEILPEVRAARPDVRVAVAGGGLRDHVVEELTSHDVEVLGFVDDLEPVYREAAAVIVPLRYGAGVKFKVVEALVRGIPTVTTSVGNEGITPADAAHVSDSSDGFARAVLSVLGDLPAAERYARNEAPHVADQFGTARFKERLQEVYL